MSLKLASNDTDVDDARHVPNSEKHDGTSGTQGNVVPGDVDSNFGSVAKKEESKNSLVQETEFYYRKNGVLYRVPNRVIVRVHPGQIMRVDDAKLLGLILSKNPREKWPKEFAQSIRSRHIGVLQVDGYHSKNGKEQRVEGGLVWCVIVAVKGDDMSVDKNTLVRIPSPTYKDLLAQFQQDPQLKPDSNRTTGSKSGSRLLYKSSDGQPSMIAFADNDLIFNPGSSRKQNCNALNWKVYVPPPHLASLAVAPVKPGRSPSVSASCKQSELGAHDNSQNVSTAAEAAETGETKKDTKRKERTASNDENRPKPKRSRNKNDDDPSKISHAQLVANHTETATAKWMQEKVAESQRESSRIQNSTKLVLFESGQVEENESLGADMHADSGAAQGAQGGDRASKFDQMNLSMPLKGGITLLDFVDVGKFEEMGSKGTRTSTTVETSIFLSGDPQRAYTAQFCCALPTFVRGQQEVKLSMSVQSVEQ